MLPSQVEVVADLEAELTRLADLAKGRAVALLAVGRVGRGQVGKRRRQLGAPRFDFGELGLHGLDLGAELAHLGDLRLGVRPRALGLGDLI